ncbi:hypothetical protein, partial [Klebsiella pneumoniae]|uniref:hypothetical protein n=1 Tax=Klebsiella pneumoniae TaxID=573 RepID=UPI001C70A3B9
WHSDHHQIPFKQLRISSALSKVIFWEVFIANIKPYRRQPSWGHVVLLLFQGALVHFARCSVAKTDDTGHLVNIINVKENLHERREEW